jgi:hypothetical protein
MTTAGWRRSERAASSMSQPTVVNASPTPRVRSAGVPVSGIAPVDLTEKYPLYSTLVERQRT